MECRSPNLPFVLLAPLALVLLAGCDEEAKDAPEEVLTQDPQLARALNDPLMVDPDLSWRSEANAVLAIRDGHPLPLFDASAEASRRAREAMRLELLEDGQIAAMPPASSEASRFALGDAQSANAMVEEVGGRGDCADRLEDSLEWSTRMPAPSTLPPHSMVQQAAGIAAGECDMRIVRYLTPAGIDYVLEFHFANADRARFEIALYRQPEAQIFAERRDQVLVVAVRAGPGGMSAVDVIHWRK